MEIYIGDTEGSLHIVKPEIAKREAALMIEKSNYNYHRINILKILPIIKDSIIFTIGFD